MSGSRAPQPDILVVIPKLVTGGAERQLLGVYPRLSGLGFGVRIFTTRGPGPLDEALRVAGVPVVTPPALFKGRANALVAAVHLFFLLLRKRPDIIHFYLSEAYLVGGPVAILTGCARRVMSRRNQNVHQQRRPLVRRLETWLHRRMSAVIGNSRALVDELAGEGVPPERLALIYGGIDPAPYAELDRAAAREALGIGPDQLVLLILATLWPYKGHADLLQALDRCRESLPKDWLLLAAGRDQGAGPSLERQTAALGLTDNVRWLGECDDIRGLLAAGDISLLVSHQEGFPVSILEGMAAGLPVIATRVGGSAESIDEGVTGLLVPPGDPTALAEAILALAGDPARRARMGAAGRARLAERFSLDACVEAHARLYRALLADETGPLQTRLEESAPRA